MFFTTKQKHLAQTAVIAAFLAVSLNPRPSFGGSRDLSFATIQKITGVDREEAVLKRIWPYLRQAGKAGRLYYSVPCAPDTGFPYYPYPFPNLYLHMPAEGTTGIDAIRQIFESGKGVVVDENPEGVINIKIGKIPDEILNTKISVINFEPEEQYYDFAAIWAIDRRPEIKSKVDEYSKNGWSTPGSWLSGALVGPHLPEKLTNLTMDDALDEVAKTFRGIVVFGTCNEKHWYKAYFTGGYNYDEVKAKWQ
jgi:hypothetical protein